MSFQTALSGLNAAQTNLGVTGNNIANASTNGFKRSRAEFSDIYTSSFATTSQVGSGVRVANIAQQFAQGNVEFTDNSLDLAISGEGFFIVRDTDGSELFTRAGAYTLDREGFVVNSKGQRLQGYDSDDTGVVTNTTSRDIFLDNAASPANATELTEINMNINADGDPTVYDAVAASYTTPQLSSLNFEDDGTTDLTASFEVDGIAVTLDADYRGDLAGLVDAIQGQLGADYVVAEDGASGFSITSAVPGGDEPDEAVPVVITNFTNGADTNIAAELSGGDYLEGMNASVFDPADPNTYNFSTSTTVYDSLGGSHTQTLYFLKTEDENTWESYMTIDGNMVGGAQTLEFAQNGRLVTTPSTLDYGTYAPGNGAEDMVLSVDYDGSTQFAGESVVNSIVQDGYTTGRISGIEIDQNGVVFARYTNGQATVLGAVAMARFANPNGLQPVGDTNWVQTFSSGEIVRGQAGRGTFGQIQSGALEASNVDLSNQLVNMIIAQRDFQANAKMISTEDQVTQSIINIR